MVSDSPGYSVFPYPRMRRLVMDAGWMARRRHTMHGFLEMDVTIARQVLQEYKTRMGEQISFTAFFLACLGQAIEQDKRVHACRNWRNQLIIFDDVDVLLSIEIDVGQEKLPLVHAVRGVNRRTVRSIHDEIRVIQADLANSAAARTPLMRWLYLLPGVVRHTLYRFVLKSPQHWKQFAGTVGLTSVGMFGSSGGCQMVSSIL